MSFSDITTIKNPSSPQLEQINYEEELRRNYKSNLICSIIREMDVKQLADLNADEQKNVENVKRKFIVQDVFEFTKLLEYDNSKLTYTEKKSVKEYISRKICKNYKPISDLIDHIKNTHPEFMENKLNDKKTLVDLEFERIRYLNELIERKAKLIELLYNVVELKLSTSIHREAENLLVLYKTSKMRAQLFGYLIQHDLINAANYSTKSFKIVEAELDRLIEERVAKQDL